MKLSYILWLIAATGVFLSGATTSRAYVGNSNIWLLILSLGLYMVGNLIMLKLMRDGGLGLAISLSSLVQLVMINLIAVTVFGEKLNPTQLVGLALGIVSMGLMMLPTSGKV